MKPVETLEEYYRRKFDWMPDNLRNDLGHFNVLKLDPFVGEKARPVPYRRRDYYKVMLVLSESDVYYADKAVHINKQALSFSNPQIPYKWEHAGDSCTGVYCIFNRQFIQQYGNLDQYSVFQPDGNHVFELSDQQVDEVEAVFRKMFAEISSEYAHKYDVLRNLTAELIHYGMKMQPSDIRQYQPVNASRRISMLFMELLERQFPVDDTHQLVELRKAADYALKLNVHVNHLNRAVKEITGKTTTALIAERVLQEAKILLRHSNWNVSEISYALGFTEPSHFNSFFKKNTQVNPLRFRNDRLL